MVKTRSHRASDTETTTDSEIQTEYSDDFEDSSSSDHEHSQGEATVIQMPGRSQSTPLMRATSRREPNLTRKAKSLDIVTASPFVKSIKKTEKCKKTDTSEMLDAFTTVMKTIVQENEKAMRNMTDTLLAHIDNKRDPKVDAAQKDRSVRRRRSQAKTHNLKRRTKIREISYPISDNSSSSDDDSDVSSSSDDEYAKKKNSNTGSRLPVFTGKEKWKIWFNRFEAVAEIQGWNKRRN